MQPAYKIAIGHIQPRGPYCFRPGAGAKSAAPAAPAAPHCRNRARRGRTAPGSSAAPGRHAACRQAVGHAATRFAGTGSATRGCSAAASGAVIRTARRRRRRSGCRAQAGPAAAAAPRRAPATRAISCRSGRWEHREYPVPIARQPAPRASCARRAGSAGQARIALASSFGASSFGASSSGSGSRPGSRPGQRAGQGRGRRNERIGTSTGRNGRPPQGRAEISGAEAGGRIRAGKGERVRSVSNAES